MPASLPHRVRPPSRALLSACAIFGLDPHPRAARRADRALARGQLRASRGGPALLLGPSGSGKSTLLREIARQARSLGLSVVAARAPMQARSTLDAIARVRPPGGLRGALACLAAAGLADALVLPRPPSHLSDGQRARLGIALAVARAEKRLRAGSRVVVLFDEFGAALDRTTAMALCVTLSRWLNRHPLKRRLRIVCATSHDDVERWLRPASIVRLDASGAFSPREAA